MAETKKYPLITSIWLAFSGILKVVQAERNMKIHLVLGLLACGLGIAVSLNKAEWLALILIIFAVLAAETFNSAVERICDLLREKLSLGYKETKVLRDISAGAVLLLALASIILGLIIFLPHLFSL